LITPSKSDQSDQQDIQAMPAAPPPFPPPPPYPPSLAHALGDRLREYLQEQRCSQRVFAQQLGLTQSAVSFLLKGARRRKTLDLYAAIAHALGLRLSELIIDLEARTTQTRTTPPVQPVTSPAGTTVGSYNRGTTITAADRPSRGERMPIRVTYSPGAPHAARSVTRPLLPTVDDLPLDQAAFETVFHKQVQTYVDWLSAKYAQICAQTVIEGVPAEVLATPDQPASGTRRAKSVQRRRVPAKRRRTA
jgi:hypothetical protein